MGWGLGSGFGLGSPSPVLMTIGGTGVGSSGRIRSATAHVSTTAAAKLSATIAMLLGLI
jgi:hypothetical protein